MEEEQAEVAVNATTDEAVQTEPEIQSTPAEATESASTEAATTSASSSTLDAPGANITEETSSPAQEQAAATTTTTTPTPKPSGVNREGYPAKAQPLPARVGFQLFAHNIYKQRGAHLTSEQYREA